MQDCALQHRKITKNAIDEPAHIGNIHALFSNFLTPYKVTKIVTEPTMPILVFLALFTLLDFVLLFSIGSQIGLLATLLVILGTGFIGLYLIRKEGMATFARARERMQMGEIPSSELLSGASLMFAGALLLAPGFLSDALGIVCLLPNARQLLLKGLGWMGLKSSGNRSYEKTSHHSDNQGHSDSGYSSSHQTSPIEGDFISKEEPTGRR